MRDFEEILLNKGYDEIDSLTGEENDWAKAFKDSIIDCINDTEMKTYDDVKVYVKMKDVDTSLDVDDAPVTIGVGLFHIYTFEKANKEDEIVTRFDSFIKILDTIEIRSKEEMEALNKIYDEFDYDIESLKNTEERKEDWKAA